MGKALYRKYRSRSLEEIVGQPQVTELLSRALKRGRIAHAYLFTGPKGVGKTSIARILAHQINGIPYSDDATHLDIVEIDAASNNSVEDIRDLREKVRLAPVNAKRKVYIIDEVHMLSKSAFNALLKTLEEPPEHVVFILATTDVEKIPETILSRTQRHNFRRASETDIVKNLKRIAEAEKVSVSPEALATIAHHSDGSYRDSVSIFDQLISLADEKEGVSAELVRTSLGLASEEHIANLLQASLSHDVPAIIATLDELESQGTPIKAIIHQLTQYIRHLIPNEPELALLLDKLLELLKSGTHDLKLLTTLSLFSSTTLSGSKPIATELSPKQLEKPKAESDSMEKSEDAKPAEKPKKATKAKPAVFDWKKLLAHVRSHHVALHSVLSKCEPLFEENKLTLYTKNQFYKTKLDTSKYRALLSSSLEETGMGELDIETLPTSAPLKDGNAARVAAIMGGGEEVSVEDA